MFVDLMSRINCNFLPSSLHRHVYNTNKANITSPQPPSQLFPIQIEYNQHNLLITVMHNLFVYIVITYKNRAIFILGIWMLISCIDWAFWAIWHFVNKSHWIHFLLPSVILQMHCCYLQAVIVLCVEAIWRTSQKPLFMIISSIFFGFAYEKATSLLIALVPPLK